MYYRQNKAKESIEALKKALDADPDNANALNSLGFIYAEENMFLDQAVAMCRKALDAHPETPRIWIHWDGLCSDKVIMEKRAPTSAALWTWRRGTRRSRRTCGRWWT